MIQTIKQQALEHYDRMIAWAKAQPQKDSARYTVMYTSLGEAWGSMDCPYCRRANDLCGLCVLGRHDACYGALRCYGGDECCGGRWIELDAGYTWGDWIASAKKVRKYIKDNG